MTYYLTQTDSGLLILLNEKERPEREFFVLSYKRIPEADDSYNTKLNLWLSSCERYPLAPREEEKFKKLVWDVPAKIDETLDYWLKQGIKIPAENVRIGKHCENRELPCSPDSETNGFCKCKAFAYFVEPIQDNHCPTCGSPVIIHSSDEGTSYMEPITEDHWPSDEWIESNSKDRNKLYSWSKGMKDMRDYLKQNFNLIPKEK